VNIVKSHENSQTNTNPISKRAENVVEELNYSYENNDTKRKEFNSRWHVKTKVSPIKIEEN